MKLFAFFIKSKRTAVFTFLIFALIFAAAFLLSGLPIAAVIYPSLLCALLGIIILIAEFFKFRKKYNILERIKQMTAATVSGLPSADSIIEDQYHGIIANLKSETAKIENDSAVKFRDMTEYYSVWAHQIKTPIASMKLTLQNEDSALARKLNSDLFRIEQYVEMVLAFLRLDSSSSDYLFKEYDVDGIVRQSVKKFASDFIGRKIRLEYEPLNERVITDEKWLSFVIEQILSNSLKYTRDGSIKIYMDEPHRLCITDTGIGIAPEDLPRIFENGYTGFNGRVDKSASGIGLYLCRRICENLGIEITAQSELGTGTTIRLDLSQNNCIKE